MCTFALKRTLDLIFIFFMRICFLNEVSQGSINSESGWKKVSLCVETFVSPKYKAVNSKEDPLEHPYVILINIHDYEYQTRINFFRDNECMKK